MTKKLTPSHIAVAVAAGLTAQTAFSQMPTAPQSNTMGQEMTPMIKLEKNQYSGQGFFDKPAGAEEKKIVQPATPFDKSPSVNAPALATAPGIKKTSIKDPMLPLDLFGSKDTKKEPMPVISVPTVNTNLKKSDSPSTATSPIVAEMPVAPLLMPARKITFETPTAIKASVIRPDVAIKYPVKKKHVVKRVLTQKPIVESPFTTMEKEAVAVDVKELPSTTVRVAPALYAAVPTTPIVITEVVRIDSISLQAPTSAEKETTPLPRLPELPVVAMAPTHVPTTIVEPVIKPLSDNTPLTVASTNPVPQPLAPRSKPLAIPTARIDVPMVSASMDDLPALEAPTVNAIRSNSRLTSHETSTPVAAPYSAPSRPRPPLQAVPAAPVVMAASAPRTAQDNRDDRIQMLLEEIKTLQSNSMPVESVLPPVEAIAQPRSAVPKINPAATIQLPLPEAPPALIKPIPKEPARMATKSAPKAPMDTAQTVAIDAPRTMTPAPILEPRTHRVANPKFVGLPEKGDFIAFMPGSSHVSEETVESLRSMVDVFKQHGIRKVMLTGTSLRDEDTEDMESSDFAQKRAKNLKIAFQRAGFKGIIALDDPKRARPGTTPRVGLVALQ